MLFISHLAAKRRLRGSKGLQSTEEDLLRDLRLCPEGERCPRRITGAWFLWAELLGALEVLASKLVPNAEARLFQAPKLPSKPCIICFSRLFQVLSKSDSENKWVSSNWEVDVLDMRCPLPAALKDAQAPWLASSFERLQRRIGGSRHGV